MYKTAIVLAVSLLAAGSLTVAAQPAEAQTSDEFGVTEASHWCRELGKGKYYDRTGRPTPNRGDEDLLSGYMLNAKQGVRTKPGLVAGNAWYKGPVPVLGSGLPESVWLIRVVDDRQTAPERTEDGRLLCEPQTIHCSLYRAHHSINWRSISWGTPKSSWLLERSVPMLRTPRIVESDASRFVSRVKFYKDAVRDISAALIWASQNGSVRAGYEWINDGNFGWTLRDQILVVADALVDYCSRLHAYYSPSLLATVAESYKDEVPALHAEIVAAGDCYVHHGRWPYRDGGSRVPCP